MYDLHILYLLHYIIFFIDTVFFIQLHFLFLIYLILFFFFFFQAEDGIRDKLVTGVQTCALPIFGIPVSDERVAEAPFYRPPENSPEMKYLRERRKALGGPVPVRNNAPVTLEVDRKSVV